MALKTNLQKTGYKRRMWKKITRDIQIINELSADTRPEKKMMFYGLSIDRYGIKISFVVN